MPSAKCRPFYLKLQYDINGFVQDCSNSIANALGLLQSCTKPLMYRMYNVWLAINKDFWSFMRWFSLDAVKNENQWRITSQVTKKKILIQLCIISLLTFYLILWTDDMAMLKTNMDHSFRHYDQRQPILTCYCNITEMHDGIYTSGLFYKGS